MEQYYMGICDEAIHLSPEDKKKILGMVKRHDREKARRYTDGTRIKLDELPNELVKRIYEFIKRRVETQ